MSNYTCPYASGTSSISHDMGPNSSTRPYFRDDFEKKIEKIDDLIRSISPKIASIETRCEFFEKDLDKLSNQFKDYLSKKDSDEKFKASESTSKKIAWITVIASIIIAVFNGIFTYHISHFNEQENTKHPQQQELPQSNK